VYDLRPPTLDELGLIEAIREQAARYNDAPANLVGGEDTGTLRVTLDVPERLPPLPAAVEVAAYRIIQEALMNVSRHARARTCTLRLVCANGRTLEVEVIDDGAGLPDHPRAGVGLRSMRERAAELGGACEIAGVTPQGTRVAAWFPILSDNQAEANSYGSTPYSHR
jgi:signal transduction histidine kinase